MPILGKALSEIAIQAVSARTTWRRALIPRLPYSVAVLSIGECVGFRIKSFWLKRNVSISRNHQENQKKSPIISIQNVSIISWKHSHKNKLPFLFLPNHPLLIFPFILSVENNSANRSLEILLKSEQSTNLSCSPKNSYSEAFNK